MAEASTAANLMGIKNDEGETQSLLKLTKFGSSFYAYRYA